MWGAEISVAVVATVVAVLVVLSGAEERMSCHFSAQDPPESPGICWICQAR